MHHFPVFGIQQAIHSIVRNDMDVQFWRQFNEPFRQRWFSQQQPTGYPTTAQHNFRHARQAGKLRNLIGHIIAIHRLDRGAQLLCQTHIALKALLIPCIHPLKCLGLHEQRGKSTPKRPCHPGRRAYDFLIGRGGRQAHQNMLMGAILRLHLLLGVQSRPIRTAAQAHLSQGAEL